MMFTGSQPNGLERLTAVDDVMGRLVEDLRPLLMAEVWLAAGSSLVPDQETGAQLELGKPAPSESMFTQVRTVFVGPQNS